MVTRATDWWRRNYAAFVRALDAESIVAFQAMYYVLIIIAGLYLTLFANAPPQNVEPVMGDPQYQMWLGLNLICPVMTLTGRRLASRSAGIAPGKMNPARGAAWLQLVGDGGVWGAVTIYVACLMQTTVWGTGLYGAFFAMMGIPGGAMFTVRNVRRLLEIRRYEQVDRECRER